MRWQWTAFHDLDLDALYALMMLRQQVFVVEQRCAYQDADGLDPQAWHLLGWDEGALVAVLRAFAPGLRKAEAVIGRVVTGPSVRGTGWGRPLMRAGMEATWRQWGPGPIAISAQAHLKGYYGSLGFVVTGPGYLEDDIPHLPMRHPGPP